MTEFQWAACRDPLKMFTFVKDLGFKNRKFRLLAVACHRFHYDREGPKRLVVEASSVNVQEAAYREADGGSYDEVLLPHRVISHGKDGDTSWVVADRCPITACYGFMGQGHAVFADYLRDIFEPFRQTKKLKTGADFAYPFKLHDWLDWQGGTVKRLADEAYEGVSIHGVIADALDEAGCDDAGLLAHLRSPGPHVRGCWALDLLTGRFQA